MEYILDATGVAADALLMWWILAGPTVRRAASKSDGSKNDSFKRTTPENDPAIDSSRC